MEVSDLRLEGEPIRARQKGVVSGDWLTISPDGKRATLDVRVTVETDDGALISKGKVPPDMSWIEYEVFEAR